MDEARRRLYSLLGRLLLGPEPEDVAVARQLPALAGAFPDGPWDALAASHHSALGLEVLPFVPVFLDAEGLLADPDDDHVGAWLVAIGAGAEHRLPVLQRVLAPLVLALRDAGEPGWPVVAELALELALSHGPPPGPWAPAGALPGLDDPGTDLRTVAAALCRPACSGWFPTRRALARIAAAADVPSGFGDRAGMVRSALLAASDAGRLPAWTAALGAELAAWDQGYATLPGPIGPWRERLAATRALVARLG